MRWKNCLIGAIASALLVPAVATAQRPPADERGDYQIIINTKQIPVSILSSEVSEAKVRSRASIMLQASPDEIRQGQVPVAGFNAVYLNVPQFLLTGREGKTARGVVGFVADAEEEQWLLYDENSQTLSGELRGRVDIAQVAAEASPNLDSQEDVAEVPTQFATLAVEMRLEEPFDLRADAQEISKIAGELAMRLVAEPDDRYGTLEYRLDTIPTRVITEYVPIFWWEGVRRLCVQPVRVGSFGYSPISGFNLHLSGDGLAYGQPGAQTQWAKADVEFQYRPWKTFWYPGYLTLSGSEAAGLRALVEDDDCVEVFFVDQFSPNAMWGGGATWGSGTATTQIISSDQNADFGLDPTHLAHELGHAIALMHPSSSSAQAGSTGTLMCPSGFMNDNPAVQSVENEDNVANPLFTFGWKLVSSGPDCSNSADCGPCD